MQELPTLKTSRLKSGAAAHDERRRSTRHAVSAVVQIMDTRSGTRLTTRASDLGLGGCYVDTLTPLPVGTEVKLGLHKDKVLIELTGKIIYSHPGLGMGIAFVDGAPTHRVALEQWLSGLSTVTYAGNPGSDRGGEAPPTAARAGETNGTGADARGAIARLVNLLLAKGILTEDDADMILQKRKNVI
ncbi:MAG: PilZ domain-containing protein [Candidatus Acidiferrales bacterium]